MASKSKKIEQPCLFDVPAMKTVTVERDSSTKKNVGTDCSVATGLNGVFEGRSLIYSSFKDYINGTRRNN